MGILDSVKDSGKSFDNIKVPDKIRKSKFYKWRIFEFVKDKGGNFSGSRLFALILTVTIIIDWITAVITATDGIWHPNWQDVGMVLGVLGFKFSQKIQNK